MFRTRLRVSVVVALVAAVAAPLTPAHAEHGPQGLLCGFVSVTDPGTEGGDVQTGEMNGGPILVTGDGTITCDIQVGQELSSGSNAASVSGSGNTVVYATPTVVSYVSPPDVPVYLCTTVTDATGTYYWDDLTGDWVSSAAAARCSLATSASGGGDPTEPGGPATPVYPRGMVRIYREVGGGVHTYADPLAFDPPLWDWDCYAPSLTSYRCTPPPPAWHRDYNVCGTVAVVVDNGSAGTVTGRSGCASGLSAEATTTPVTPASGFTAPAQAGFPWTCSVSESFLASFGPWSVTCAVG